MELISSGVSQSVGGEHSLILWYSLQVEWIFYRATIAENHQRKREKESKGSLQFILRFAFRGQLFKNYRQ